MAGLVAFDLVLRLVPGRVASLAQEGEIPGMDGDDLPPDMSRLGVPADRVADGEAFGHRGAPGSLWLIKANPAVPVFVPL